ncbi:MAG: phospholipase D-like domain-containing protein [Dehalococcoidia bacterium]
MVHEEVSERDEPLEVWRSPLGDAFLEQVKATRNSLFIVSPYIRKEGASKVIDGLRANPRLSELNIRVLTRKDKDAFAGRHAHLGALLDLLKLGDRTPGLEMRWLPNLHAKIYVFDEECALVTSANLTGESLFGGGGSGDIEYGVLLKSSEAVRKVLSDVEEVWCSADAVSSESLRRMERTIAAENEAE